MILGVDGKVLSKEYFKIDDYEFEIHAMQENPLMVLMGAICIDPTEKQKEFLNKLGVVYYDSTNKQVFPKEDEGNRQT